MFNNNPIILTEKDVKYIIPDVIMAKHIKDIILVTGGDGMVGNYFKTVPGAVVLGRDDLDVTKPKTIEAAVKKYAPKAIVHLAAMTDVDYAQDHPGEAFAVNALGTYKVAQVAKKYGIHLVYVSTGAVFYGQAQMPYTVKSKPNPRSIYAKSKRMGEEFVQSLCDKYSIVRTGWVFGGFQKDKKFVAAIARQIWAGNTQLKAIDDAFGCPTYGKDLRDVILQLIETADYGVFHAVNQGYASRYQIARLIAREIGDSSIKVSRAQTADFPAFNAPRPKFEVIEQNLPLRSWKKAVKEYLADWQDLHKASAKSKTVLSKRIAKQVVA